MTTTTNTTSTDLKRLGTKETAARIRADIKNLQKFKLLPAGKFSVTMDSFSGGSSIDVRVVDIEATMFNTERFAAEKREPRNFPEGIPWTTVEGARIMALLNKVVGVYHRDESDPMTDYFNCNFYFHIGASGQEDKERSVFEALAKIDAEDEAESAAAVKVTNDKIKAFAAERATALAALDGELAATGVLTLRTEALHVDANKLIAKAFEAGDFAPVAVEVTPVAVVAPVAVEAPVAAKARKPKVSIDEVVAAIRVMEDTDATAYSREHAVDLLTAVSEAVMVKAYMLIIQ
jgi:hypothetical protein